MSTGAAQARKQRPRGYYLRPDDEPRNTGRPRRGKWVQNAMILTDGIIYSALKSLVSKQVRGGYLVANASVTAIANATRKFTPDKEPLPRRTVAHRLVAMARKGIIQRWDVATNSPTIASNSPFGTSWLVPLFEDVLDRWANDPNVGTESRRIFYVQGKEKKLLTPADLVRWGIDDALAAVSPAAQASYVALAAEASVATTHSPAAPTLGEDLLTVHRAILDIGVQATEVHAAKLVELARQVEPTIPAETIIELCQKIALDWQQKVRSMPESQRPHQRLTIGWFQTGMPAAATLWKHERDRATAATRAG